MKFKYIISFALFLLLCNFVSGQKNSDLNVIYLHGGGYLKGTISETDNPTYIQIRLYDGTVVELPKAMIRETNEGRKPLFEGGKVYKNKGYFGTVSGGWFNAQGRYGDFDLTEWEWGIGLNTTHGYQFNQHLGVGLGVGAIYFADFAFIPVFLNLRSYPFDTRFAPYANLDIGYGFALDNDDDREDRQGGIMVHPAIGLNFPSRHKVNFFMELGMKFQKAKRIQNWWGENIDEIMFRRTSLVFGIRF